MVDNTMDIDVPLDHYDYQQIEAIGRCRQGDAKRTTIDTKYFDSGSGDYQVVCAINCYTWDCGSPIEAVKGKVEIQKDGNWQKLIEETKVKEGDVIKTGSSGNVNLKLDNIIGPGSEVEVEAEDSILLKAGKMWAWVGHIIEGQFKVKTPGAAASIRGTEFILEYDESTSTSTLHLQKGEIELTSTAGEVKEIVAGQTAITNEDGTIQIESLDLSQEEWNAFIQEQVFEGDDVGKTLLIFGILFIISAGILAGITFIIKKKSGKKTKAWGVGSLVLGILSILLFVVSFLGLALGVFAIYYNRVQKNINPTGLAKAGLILGIIGTVLSTFFLYIVLFAV